MSKTEIFFSIFYDHEPVDTLVAKTALITQEFILSIIFSLVAIMKIMGYGTWCANHSILYAILMIVTVFLFYGFNNLLKAETTEGNPVFQKRVSVIILTVLTVVVIASLNGNVVLIMLFVLFAFQFVFHALRNLNVNTLGKYGLWVVGVVMLLYPVLGFYIKIGFCVHSMFGFTLTLVIALRQAHTTKVAKDFYLLKAEGAQQRSLFYLYNEHPYLFGFYFGTGNFFDIFNFIGEISNEMIDFETKK